MAKKPVELQTVEEMHKSMTEFFETTRYHPDPANLPKDEHGMTIVAPEPDDPDDE